MSFINNHTLSDLPKYDQLLSADRTLFDSLKSDIFDAIGSEDITSYELSRRIDEIFGVWTDSPNNEKSEQGISSVLSLMLMNTIECFEDINHLTFAIHSMINIFENRDKDSLILCSLSLITFAHALENNIDVKVDEMQNDLSEKEIASVIAINEILEICHKISDAELNNIYDLAEALDPAL